MSTKLFQPTHYTTVEGGKWNVYEGEPFTREGLGGAHDTRMPIQRGSETIHSIAFVSVDSRQAWLRWDHENGFTAVRDRDPEGVDGPHDQLDYIKSILGE